jgi:hypothetical protein
MKTEADGNSDRWTQRHKDIKMNTKTEGHRGRWKFRQMDTQTDGHTDRWTHRQMERYTYDLKEKMNGHTDR